MADERLDLATIAPKRLHGLNIFEQPRIYQPVSMIPKKYYRSNLSHYNGFLDESLELFHPHPEAEEEEGLFAVPR